MDLGLKRVDLGPVRGEMFVGLRRCSDSPKWISTIIESLHGAQKDVAGDKY